MNTPLEQVPFENKLEFWENQQQDRKVDFQQASTMNHEAGHYEELDLFLSRTKELRKAVKFPN
jgi:hypothetical protein